MASLTTRLSDLTTRIATEFKSLRTLVNGNASTNAALKTTAKGNLVAAINEIFDRVTGAGTGDMQKATYDANGDGVVDRASSAASADAVAWGNVSGKPASYPPSAFDAALITSGTIDPARIPVMGSGVQVMSPGGIADLTAANQNKITAGTIVTTTDGQRWVYSGTGTKTLEASYVVLADVTPEWAAIANKPTSIAGYGITDAYTKTDIGNPDTNFVSVFEAGIA
ncbi:MULTISPECIES: hypothetical protein [unclassified Methylobacterium]|uniref:hypothetical protein n=1 Tax=unclassified Methylobacterium TaxID=2615210 RepID=UPI0011C20A07|nr:MULTISPECIES: hypothetical protein [unclassified Methylobacterium]QEE37946.1 hypothetical protein FVA80_02175 [Methylobacterium sp. WL1]TXN59786.1 hypothetical protein FV241_00005 [Methylobacterium sp. WL2]